MRMQAESYASTLFPNLCDGRQTYDKKKETLEAARRKSHESHAFLDALPPASFVIPSLDLRPALGPLVRSERRRQLITVPNRGPFLSEWEMNVRAGTPAVSVRSSGLPFWPLVPSEYDPSPKACSAFALR